MSLAAFHPAVAAWFSKRFASPTAPQARAWPEIQSRKHTLIAAPTGSGKTLAAFLAAIDDLVRQGIEGPLEDVTQVVYVSPLKALTNDVHRNLQVPLEGIREELKASGLPEVPIRTLVRTGDTPAAERQAMVRRPPHIVVTTPESFYILLTSERGRSMLKTARTIIVDEIHAIVGDKRGSHLALSIERLEHLAGRRVARVGLSATQKPIEEVARFLVGTQGIGPDGAPDCAIVDTGHARNLDLAVEVPASPLESVMSGEVWQEVYDRLAALILQHRTTLVFVNTRRMAERVGRHIAERIGADNVTSHHGSLSRERRLDAERRLKGGELRALVATASLELGIDIGAVDLVCQLGSTRSIATLLQRVGRSGHAVGGFPKGRIFPLSRDELVECAALLQAVRRGELDRIEIPEAPLDILSQQIVASVACDEWSEEALFRLLRRAYPYRNLSRTDFDDVVEMTASGFATARGRRGAYIHHDGVNGKLRARRGARLAAITSGGAIPDTSDYDVVLEPAGIVVGNINEDFAVESLPGNIFQLGNASWRILRIEPGKVRVEDARGQPPSIPFWLGEAPARTPELSTAVSRVRLDVGERIAGGEDAAAWMMETLGLPRAAAEQIAEYLAAGKAALGVMPSQRTLVLERFFDETGGMQLVVHSLFGSRINRAWGLALRKRFCRKFNFELQAAATDNAIVLSLGPTHSFPLDEVFHYLRSEGVRELLIQALLDAPVFPVRWRWNASRSLALLRWRGGKKVPGPIQRMDADDLLSVVFPDQLACAENVPGEREIPDHPLVKQTLRDCLEEAMDIQGLEALLESMERGEKTLVAADLTEPSPLSHEVLNAKPYAYLDDAPLEERRTQAVFARRWLDPATAADLGKLDLEAIERVRAESAPIVTSADELHDALMVHGFLTEPEGREWRDLFEELKAGRRAETVHAGAGTPAVWVCAERLPEILSAFHDVQIGPLAEILRGRLEMTGPATARSLAAPGGFSPGAVEAALLKLEGEGFVLRGRFTNAASGSGGSGEEIEWCARRLLARIHRYTLDRLRREIDPVSAADFMRFLFSWQRVSADKRAEGPHSLASIIDQLEGFEAPASAWEGEILPARVADYDPVWLDALCLSGRVLWARLTPPKSSRPAPEGSKACGPVRSTPIALLNRTHLPIWNRIARNLEVESSAVSDASGEQARRDSLSAEAGGVYEALGGRGASFFEDLVRASGLLRTQVENALGELVARGLVASDGFTGLRALLTPSNKRRPLGAGRRKGGFAIFGMESAGRWSRLWDGPVANTQRPGGGEEDERNEAVARLLLKRYGVIFRRLLEREGITPPWRDLLRVYRRLEDRGEIRGGRFVDGFQGEQFALPDAVGLLRAVRREAACGSLVSISAADPVNLVGILTPGGRVSPLAGNRILFRDGCPVAIREATAVRFLVEMDPAAQWQAKNALLRRSVPPQLRAYLGQSA